LKSDKFWMDYRTFSLRTFSMNRSQKGRRKPSLAIGPASVNCTYAREVASNLGHDGNGPPLGLPVLAKLVQYCCMVSETCVSTWFAGTGGPPTPPIPRSIVPKMYESSNAWVAPNASLPAGIQAKSSALKCSLTLGFRTIRSSATGLHSDRLVNRHCLGR
jgi:hypothetical protein